MSNYIIHWLGLTLNITFSSQHDYRSRYVARFVTTDRPYTSCFYIDTVVSLALDCFVSEMSLILYRKCHFCTYPPRLSPKISRCFPRVRLMSNYIIHWLGLTLNIGVTGLPEIATSSPTDDCDTFTKFCEEHLCVKPALSHRGCRRLGKRTDQRPRRLLVRLTSENSVTSLLAASRALRRNETTKEWVSE